MIRNRTKSARPRLSRDAERLVAWAQGLSASGSHVEDRFWETRLGDELTKLLDHGADGAIDAALDYLFTALPSAYDALIDLVEAHAESMLVEGQQALLVAAPIVAWSKYAIASGPLREDARALLAGKLCAHVAAEHAKIALAPYLYSIDQLPRGFAETRALTRELARRALGLTTRARDSNLQAETAPLLADTRYLVAAIVANPGEALFRWQEPQERPRQPVIREQALERWRTQTLSDRAGLLPGCVSDVLLPDGYHVACRDSDQAIRPYGVRAALAYLEATLSVSAAEMRAVVAQFGSERGEEYRVGFSRRADSGIAHGTLWPLYGREDGSEPGGPQDQIEALLKECGVGEVVVLEQLFPMEFCDDCGAPMYSDPTGDLVHAELPEEVEPPRAHLH